MGMNFWFRTESAERERESVLVVAKKLFFLWWCRGLPNKAPQKNESPSTLSPLIFCVLVTRSFLSLSLLGVFHAKRVFDHTN